MEEQELPWLVIETYFKDNPRSLVQHHLNSFNDFFGNGIQRVMKEKNPIRIMKQQDPITKEFRLKTELYFGGKNGNKIYFGKPIIYDDERAHFMYPNEARLRNMTYGVTVHYDIDVNYSLIEDDGSVTNIENTIEKVLLGRFPIMLMSKLCILDGLEPEVRFNLGECRNDNGGYFIIDGKEKVIISQEKFADNMLYVRGKGNEVYSHSAEIRSVSEDASKPVRTVGVRIVRPSAKLSNNNIVVSVPNVRKPVPLFILMRALGLRSDKEIIHYCLLDMDKYSHYIDLFIPSIHDAGSLFTQELCLKYIASLTKGKTIPTVMDILMNYFLPHVGELNFQEKAYFVGHMVRELLMVFTGEKKPTDRDNFKFKRIETSGQLIYDLFKEYYSLQQRQIFQLIDKEYFFHQDSYSKTMEDWISLIDNNITDYVKERVVEIGFRKAFKGNWGSEKHTRREGIVQDLNRLSFNSFLSHLRKLNLPLDSSAKVVGPRMLHSSQWGIIDPVDTPDGGNIGLHKHMAISAQISSGCSAKEIIRWLPKHISFKHLLESEPGYLANTTKIIVNGNWIGNTPEPHDSITLMREYKRLALIPIQFSIHWHIESNTIYIYTDSGRLYRPIYYIDEETGKPSYKREGVMEKMKSGSASWIEMITGFGKKLDKDFNPLACRVYDSPKDLYNVNDLTKLSSVKSFIEFIDSAEEETALIAMNEKQLKQGDTYTHLEIHPSLMLGVMGNQIVFPENNQLPRDLFSCGQSKQGISVYHSNYQNRIDKTGIVLNYGQTPVVKSRYMEYLSKEQHPYGENLIVAIMSYNGYNTEDAILFNSGSVARGMFRITYYNMYEAYEESSKIGGSEVDTRFANIQDNNVIGIRPGYDYGYLDEHGMIKENTQIDEKMVVIGKLTTNLSDPNTRIDSSVTPKKGQKGFVDKTFITDGEEGQRLAKVRIREQRAPAIGDKFCSRCGQKGTCGLIVDEKDMPYTEDGVRPDIIINPHALPSRMTIGQLVESLMGKACLFQGAFGDCTAFSNKGIKQESFGKLLQSNGFHNSGTEVLYNGMTGEQVESAIFIGPTYYMRLKQMVKDKINYRARGPRTVLTRQTVHGRANDGGLRIGEMERDGLIAHGLTNFLGESMMVRGDEYYVAVCNNTGAVSIYNQSRNIFLSPFADGPIKFKDGLDGSKNIENITRFGKTFSIVRVPYALKLLIQELQTMNIQLRIITEDNVDQLTSMMSNKDLKMKLNVDIDSDIKNNGENIRNTIDIMKSRNLDNSINNRDKYYDNNDNNINGELPNMNKDEGKYHPYYGEDDENDEDYNDYNEDGENNYYVDQQQQLNAIPEELSEEQMQEMQEMQSMQPMQRNIIKVKDGPVFQSNGFLGGGIEQDQYQQEGGELDEQQQQQQYQQLHAGNPMQGGSVINQTFVLSGQPQSNTPMVQEGGEEQEGGEGEDNNKLPDNVKKVMNIVKNSKENSGKTQEGGNILFNVQSEQQDGGDGEQSDGGAQMKSVSFI